MKVSILGWYGHGNLGDEAMLEALQYLFTKHFGPCEFQVFSDTQTATVPQFKPERVNEGDLFVLGGGELINRDRLFINRPNWTEQIYIPKIIMGCGVNAPRLEDHVKASLRDFDYIGVRDQASYNLLCEEPDLASKTHLVLSSCLTLPEKHGIHRNPSASVAAVIPTEREDSKRKYDEGIRTGNILERTRTELKAELLKDGFKRVMLMAFGGDDNNDLVTCNKLKEYLSEFETETCKPKTPKEALQILSECRKAYTYRLHGMLFAYSLGVPFTRYAYHSKIERNYDTLIRLPRTQALRNINEVWMNLYGTIRNPQPPSV